MPDSERARLAARFLFEAHAAGRDSGPIPDAFAPRSLDDVYEVHDGLETLWRDEKGPLAGYKIAFTTTVMQKIAGFDQPVAGPVFASTVHRSPVTLSTSDYAHLGIECEIAFEFARDLDPDRAPYSREDVAAAVGAVMPAFELVDDRHADFSKLSENILSITADTVWNAGAVLGRPVTDWRSIDLAAVSGRLRLNGTPSGEGSGSDVLGNPLDALTWLANMLVSRGKICRAGMIVLTGSIIALKFLSPGDVATFEVDQLGSANLTVT